MCCFTSDDTMDGEGGGREEREGGGRKGRTGGRLS